MLVMSFIEKIRSVLSKPNPVEVVEEFERWVQFFTKEKRKILDYISKKLVEDMKSLKDAPKTMNKSLEWYREEKIMFTRQMLTDTLESESVSLAKIDHPMYFRRRFLKSKLICEEVNELRTDESSLKNQDYVQKLFDKVVDDNGHLLKSQVLSKLQLIKDNPFHYKF